MQHWIYCYAADHRIRRSKVDNWFCLSAKSVHTVIDFRTLYDKPKAKEKKDPLSEDDLDNGEGRKTIYRIIPEGKGAEDERILENNDGFVFNSGESYVIVYQYRSKQARSKERAIIYFWIVSTLWYTIHVVTTDYIFISNYDIC